MGILEGIRESGIASQRAESRGGRGGRAEGMHWASKRVFGLRVQLEGSTADIEEGR